MIVYHGTTRRRAQRICMEGFKPKKPSKRVWFAAGRGYAKGRAKCQARRTRDRPVVLTCEINLGELAERLGKGRVMSRNGVIAINAHVPVSVLRSYPAAPDVPSSPEDLARWVNGVLRLRPHKGVGWRHPGIYRLSRWVVNRLSAKPSGRVSPGELLEVARRWLPEYFDGFTIDPESLHASRNIESIDLRVDAGEATVLSDRDPLEDEALECLLDAKPKRRMRGLALLEKAEEPDLFEWCLMFLDDVSVDVRVAALHVARRCAEGDPAPLAPLADSSDRRIRGAALAALAKHSGEDAAHWIELGLKDNSRCVRVETVALLSQLEPGKHRHVFELALYDPNPEIRKRAQGLTAGKRWAKVSSWPT